MCKCNPESLTEQEIKIKIDLLNDAVSQSYNPRPNTIERITRLRCYVPCTCESKFLTMEKARRLEESIKYITDPESKILNTRFVFTNSNNINDKHECSDELLEAIKVYQEAYNDIKTILSMS